MKIKNQEPNAIVYANQNYSAMEKDVVSLIINNLDTGFNVQPDLFQQNKTVTVTAKMLNVSTKHYYQLKRVAHSLKKKEINVIDDEKEEFDLITPFPRIRYKAGVLEVTMLADVLPHFLELKKGYTEYYLKESLSLHGFRTKRLYELLSSRKNMTHPKWKVYDSELKQYFNIKGSAYKGRPSEFELKQIAPNVDEINDITSIHISYTRDKDENGWFTLFLVEKVIQDEPRTEEPEYTDERSKRCAEKLLSLGVREDLIPTIVQNEKLQNLFWKWLHSNAEQIKNGKFNNVAGVIVKHLGLTKK